jgi:hypothetical protein
MPTLMSDDKVVQITTTSETKYRASLQSLLARSSARLERLAEIEAAMQVPEHRVPVVQSNESDEESEPPALRLVEGRRKSRKEPDSRVTARERRPRSGASLFTALTLGGQRAKSQRPSDDSRR